MTSTFSASLNFCLSASKKDSCEGFSLLSLNHHLLRGFLFFILTGFPEDQSSETAVFTQFCDDLSVREKSHIFCPFSTAFGRIKIDSGRVHVWVEIFLHFVWCLISWEQLLQISLHLFRSGGEVIALAFKELMPLAIDLIERNSSGRQDWIKLVQNRKVWGLLAHW